MAIPTYCSIFLKKITVIFIAIYFYSCGIFWWLVPLAVFKPFGIILITTTFGQETYATHLLYFQTLTALRTTVFRVLQGWAFIYTVLLTIISDRMSKQLKLSSKQSTTDEHSVNHSMQPQKARSNRWEKRTFRRLWSPLKTGILLVLSSAFGDGGEFLVTPDWVHLSNYHKFVISVITRTRASFLLYYICWVAGFV